MKVLLVSPPYVKGTHWVPVAPPLGIGQISSYLKQHGHQVLLIDAFDWNDDRLMRTAMGFKPEIIGVTGNSMIRHEQFRACNLLKITCSNAKIVAGGTHVTALPSQVLTNYPSIDIVVRNEGEETMLDLADGKPLSEIKGISYIQDGVVVNNPAREPIENLDKLPFVDWGSFNLSQYRREGDCDPLVDAGIKACLVASRGCSHRCTFCYVRDMFGRRWRTMSVKRILDEVIYLLTNFKVTYIRFFDDEFCTSRKRVVELCERILSEKLRFYWRMQTRVNSMDPELCKLMREAGCVLTELGIETGSQRILDRENKDVTVEDNRKAIRMVKEARMLVKAFIIVGNPDETVETLKETEKFMQETRPDWGSVCTGTRVLPNTDLYYELKGKDLINDDVWLEKIEIPFYPVNLSDEILRHYTLLFEGNRYRDRDPVSVVKK
jgi:radical SAM superfamily enzyme YgiQ (UPF0313 family)